MDFTICTGDDEESFDGDSSFHFNENGLLIVRSDDGFQRTYSPSGWDYIEQVTPGGA